LGEDYDKAEEGRKGECNCAKSARSATASMPERSREYSRETGAEEKANHGAYKTIRIEERGALQSVLSKHEN
jgi:hypothetical protein